MAQLYYPLPLDQVSEWPGDRGGWWHYGTDFAVPVNTPMKASFDGVIVFAGGDGASGQINGVWANGEGLTVDILRKDGLRARYGHLNRIDVRVGQKVKAGQVIGLSGNTGYTTGPHCHWELRWDAAWSGGNWADPRKLGAKPLPKLTTERIFTMGSYTPNKADQQVVKPAKGKDVWAQVRVDQTKKGNVYTVLGQNESKLVFGELWIRGAAGGTVELRISRDTITNGKRTKRSRLHTQTFIIPKTGLLKAKISGPVTTGKNERVRFLVRNDTTRNIRITHVEQAIG